MADSSPQFDPRFTVPGAEDDVVMQRCEGVGHKSKGLEKSNAQLVFKRRYATLHDSIHEAPSLERALKGWATLKCRSATNARPEMLVTRSAWHSYVFSATAVFVAQTASLLYRRMPSC